MRLASLSLVSALMALFVHGGSAFPLTPSPDGPTIEAQCPPDALVAVLYKQSELKSPFLPEDGSRALIDAYFTKQLAELIWKDGKEAEKTGNTGVLDFDPFYDGQDIGGVKDFVIAPAKVDGDKATVVVTFENIGQAKTITYQLVQEDGNWRIADIDWGELTMLGILKETYK